MKSVYFEIEKQDNGFIVFNMVSGLPTHDNDSIKIFPTWELALEHGRLLANHYKSLATGYLHAN